MHYLKRKIIVASLIINLIPELMARIYRKVVDATYA